MLAARPTCLPLRLVITALIPSAACLLGLACIDGGGSAGMAWVPLRLGRVTGLSRTGQQGRASVGRGWLPPRPPGSCPPLLCSGGLGALVSPVPRDWRPADGGGALEFIIQACLPEGASLPDTALSESWEWLAEPIC